MELAPNQGAARSLQHLTQSLQHAKQQNIAKSAKSGGRAASIHTAC